MIRIFQNRLIILFGISLIYYFDSIYFAFTNRIFATHFYPFKLKKLSQEQILILRDHFIFYNQLSEEKKKIFEHRVAKFLKKYQFSGRDILVDEEKKTIVAAIYIKLTFGWRNYLIDNFKMIILYPTSYYSEITKNHHKGEFNPLAKVIVFSWEDLFDGLKNSSDNYHLGIHEFTHALHHYSRNGKSFNAINFRNYSKVLENIFTDRKEIEQIIKTQYIRNYAFTNLYEFTAVLIEYFFESPNELKSKHPQLYKNIKQMLIYDPSK